MNTRKVILWCWLLAVLASFSAHGQQVYLYAVYKERFYMQTNSAPVLSTNHQNHWFHSFIDQELIETAMLRVPSRPSYNIDLRNQGDVFYDLFDNKSALDSGFPNGTYSIEFDDFALYEEVGFLTLTGDAYPVAPAVTNLAAVQNLDPNSDFTLNWSPFIGGTAQDFIQVRVYPVTGPGPVFSDQWIFLTSPFGFQGALDGTARSVVIPAGTLEVGGSYRLEIEFRNLIDTELNDVPEALGFAAYSTTTQISISPGGGGSDPTAPVLMATFPQNNATNVSPFSPIVFNFSEPMKPQQAIAWSANVDPANFSYTWTETDTLLVQYNGGLPSGSQITWRLNPVGITPRFEDVSGTPLATVGGQFTTSGQSQTNDCNGGSSSPGFFIARFSDYLQTSSAAPVIQDASFLATLRTPNVNPVTNAAVIHNSVTTPMIGFFGNFSAVSEYPNEGSLDASYGVGNYTMQVRRSNGATESATVTLPAFPPVPVIENFAALQNVNASGAITLNWNALTSAAGDDAISFTITDSAGFSYTVPNLCEGRTLAVTARSYTIPGGTLSAGKVYDVDLTFMRGGTRSSTITEVPGFGGSSRTTRLRISTSGGVTPPPTTLGGYSFVPNVRFRLQFPTQIGVAYQVQASTTLTNWVTLLSTNATANSVTFDDTAVSANPHRFYRARAIY